MMLPNTEVVGPRNRTEESRCVEGWAEAVHAKLLFVSDSWNPVDCSPPGSSVTLQARRLEGLPRPPPGDLPDPGIEPASLTSPVLAGGFFTTGTPGAEARCGLFWQEPREGPCDAPVTAWSLSCPSSCGPTTLLSVCLRPTFLCLEQNQAFKQSHIYHLTSIWSDFVPSTSVSAYCGILVPGLP